MMEYYVQDGIWYTSNWSPRLPHLNSPTSPSPTPPSFPNSLSFPNSPQHTSSPQLSLPNSPWSSPTLVMFYTCNAQIVSNFMQGMYRNTDTSKCQYNKQQLLKLTAALIIINSDCWNWPPSSFGCRLESLRENSRVDRWCQIADFNSSIAVEQDVWRFHVTMDHLQLRVQVVQRSQYLPRIDVVQTVVAEPTQYIQWLQNASNTQTQAHSSRLSLNPRTLYYLVLPCTTLYYQKSLIQQNGQQSAHRAIHRATHRATNRATHRAIHRATHRAIHRATHRAIHRATHRAIHRATHNGNTQSNTQSNTQWATHRATHNGQHTEGNTQSNTQRATHRATQNEQHQSNTQRATHSATHNGQHPEQHTTSNTQRATHRATPRTTHNRQHTEQHTTGNKATVQIPSER